MNNQIDLSNLGGFPLDEDALEFMQTSYTGALSAIAKLCGDKVILYGVELVAGNVSSGWISVNGEMMPFIGCPVGAKVVISNPGVDALFEDDTMHTVYYTKTATCGALGDFDFNELVPLLSFQNVWLPNDLKQKYVDNAYIAANFDGDGYGINKEKGWRILSAVVPSAKGKVFVNIDTGDADFDTAGKVGGEKEHTQTIAEMPAHKFKNGVADDGDSLFVYGGTAIGLPGAAVGNAGNTAGGSTRQGFTETLGSGNAFNVMNPFFAILTLIKL